MKNIYSLKIDFKFQIFLFTFFINSFFIKIVAQCSVFAPADVSIPCGGTTNLAASTNSVTYSVVTSACTPVAISGTNAFTTNCDDCVTDQIPIGFPFNFYGNVYNDVVISSNGLIGFGNFTYTGYTPFTIPAGGVPNNYIAGFMCDIDIRFGGTITYQSIGVAPNRQFVVSYNNVVPYNSGNGAGTGTASFQIIIQESGSFRVVISQLSANWNASNSGGFATSGAENIDGTYAFPVPTRNNTDWPGITPADQDCTIFNPSPCVFQRWELGGTTISTNPILNESPTTNTTYTAFWNCGGNICSDTTTVTIVNGQSITAGGITNNSNCSSSNGSIQLNMNNIGNGTYVLNYLNNGTPQNQNITITGNPTIITIPNLNSGSYNNFSINTGSCGMTTLAGPLTVNGTTITQSTITNNSNCGNPNGSILFNSTNLASGTHTLNYNFNGTPTSQTITTGGGTTIAQNTTFNAGNLTNTDPTWIRNIAGTTCNALAGTDNYYDVFSFTVSTTGSYTFNMCAPTIDSHASLYQNAFNGAAPCATPANFIIANDDGNSANCAADPRITATLATGVTYFLISTTFFSIDTDSYNWTFTGPSGATLITGNPTFTLPNLPGGSYTNIQLAGACGNLIAGPLTITNTGAKTWNGTNSANWNTNNNWSPSGRPNNTDCVVIPDASTTNNDPVISGANYEAFAGTLTVVNNGLLTVNNGTYLIVTDNVTVNTGGTLNFDNNSSLIQVNNIPNSGNINYNRIAPLIRGSDYVYWSSPVANQTLTSIYTTPNQGPRYQWNTTTANQNGGLGYWVAPTANMTTGRGYIIRGSSTLSMAATNINAMFTGTPNNGNISINVQRGNMAVSNVGPSLTYSNPALSSWDDNWSLIGNPYPSAINALTFLSDNSANLSGNVRLWRHLSSPAAIPSPFYQNFTYNYNSADYLTVNFTGPTSPGATDIIKAGQGFFVQRLEGAQDLTGVPVNFTNSIRKSPSNAVLSNSGFFRTNNSQSAPVSKSRIWLDIIDGTTNSSETTLLGYIDEATLGFDNKFDATFKISSSIGIYSFADNEKCVIQGRPTPFEISDEVSLGINVHSNGNYHIAIKTVDGLFENNNQLVYLEDKDLNIVHNLINSPYTFLSIPGNFENRFVLKYINSALSNPEINWNNSLSIFANNTININSSLENINEVIIYDVLGKVIFSQNNLDTKQLNIDKLQKHNQLLIVTVKLKNDQTVNKKIRF